MICGSHTMFMAEVLSIDADDKYIDKNGAFDISKCNLMAYSNGNYYTLGRKIGRFGFSVMKKTKNNKSINKNIRCNTKVKTIKQSKNQNNKKNQNSKIK